MEKEKYTAPEMEVIVFDAKIITALSDYWSEPLD